MRAALARDVVTLTPGRPTKVTLEVTNTLEVIDGISAFVDGGLGLAVRAEPALLPLFPDGTGRITLELTASSHYPAGDHDVPVDLRSASDPSASVVEWLAIHVVPDPSATVTTVPAVRSGRHHGQFAVVLDNTGNVPLDMQMAASDPDRAVRIRFEDPTLHVPPGESTQTSLIVTRRRRILGADVSHQIRVLATAADLAADTRAVFRHRPLVPRGARTVLILAAIVAAWAAIFVLALNKALADAPLTKQAPASFYAASKAKNVKAELHALGSTDSYGLAASDSGRAPAGAVPKSGVVIGVGGTVSGTVDAASLGTGIGRITVQAIRDSTHGPVLVSSAATASDGTYSIVGLLPGRYELKFSATGYHTVWWPKATTAAGAKWVTVNALGLTAGKNVTITGDLGSMTGTIETGQTPAPPVTVIVEPEQGPTTQPIATVTSNAAGHYSVADLPTPGTYDLSFAAAGYQAGTDSEVLTGGQNETANTVTLLALDGGLAGTVSDGGTPVGGVAITATANGQTFTSATPTTGAVGQFTLSNLPTPATYLVTFTKSGYGSRSVAEILGPGQSLTTLAIQMSGGAGDIDGQVDAHGAGLGGVTVTLQSGSAKTTTETLTGGDVGVYALTGLSPGSYTLTFTLAGYESTTIKVSLASSGATVVPTVTLEPATGTVTGSVSGTSGPLSGVAVAITNGTTIATTTSSSSPAGGFTFTGLAAGSYSVTFTDTDWDTATVTVVLTAGEVTSPITVTLQPSSQGGT